VEGERGLIALLRCSPGDAGRDSYAAVKGNRDALQARVMSLRPTAWMSIGWMSGRATLLNDSRSDD